MSNARRQGIFFMLTVPQNAFTPYLPPQCQYVRGQLELSESGFLHWQLLVAFKRKQSIIGVRDVFGAYHAELTRSSKAFEYVWKEETRVEGTQFELGARPFARNSHTDWEDVWRRATRGDLLAIPAQTRVVSYRTLRAIAADHSTPEPMVREVFAFIGPTATGKSRRAWEEAGMGAYAKDPRSKFWCGYDDQQHVVVDEFRGGIDISHLLRWFDRYPVRVEVKGSSRPLFARKFWVTSNVHPASWYPDLDVTTLEALMRRMTITDFT